MVIKKILGIFILLCTLAGFLSLIIWLYHKIILRFSPYLTYFFIFIIILNLLPLLFVNYQFLKKIWYSEKPRNRVLDDSVK